MAVTGITGAGWWIGETGFKPVFGSFMLFFTNLLTIELASGLVFLGTGFRQNKKDQPKEVWGKTLLVKGVLLLLTGWFLTVQLTNLLQERYGLATSRKELQSMLKEIPGADLDSLEAHLHKGTLSVNAVVGSRTNIMPETVARFEQRLKEKMGPNLPHVDIDLMAVSYTHLTLPTICSV